MTNPTAAMLVIGDEILSGRTRDTNTHHLAGALTARGIRLMEVRVVADDHAAIVAAVNALRGAWQHVFTSGGIGPTHDDITADAIAAAFGVGISEHPDAIREMAARYAAMNTEFTAPRRRMALRKSAWSDVGSFPGRLHSTARNRPSGRQPMMSDTPETDVNLTNRSRVRPVIFMPPWFCR